MDEQPKGTVLSGYRVVDLTDAQGMLCIRILSDMGAEVTCVKKPQRKRISSLVKKADIFVETQPPGYLESLGLGYDSLGQENPGLIMASITPFGQTGPYRDRKASDLVMQAMGGWLSVTGEPRAPLKLAGNQAYYTASLFAANGILLALWHRHKTGRGQYIDISIMECVAATLDHTLVRYSYEGIVSKRQGSRHWNNAFRVFPCRDGYVLLSLSQHWETMVAWLESEGMAADLTGKKWRDREVRTRRIDHIIDVLERWTLTHNVDELVEKGQLMRFPWAKVTTPGAMGNG